VTQQVSQRDATVQTSTDRRARGLVLALLAAAAVIGVLLPLALSGWTGSLSIPHNDTWAFSRSSQIFAHTGTFHLFNWNDMALVGAFVPLGPLGSSIAVQQVYVAVLALVGLGAFFDLARGVVGARRAAIGTVLVSLWPGYGLMGTSLMTDMPAFTAVCVCLALGRRAYLRGSFPLLLWSMLVGLWGVTSREQVAAAPAAILGVALLHRELRERFGLRRLLAVIAGLLVLAGLFELWRRGLAGGGSPPFTKVGTPSATLVGDSLLECWLTLALPLSPAVFLAARVREWSLWVRITSLVVLCALVAGVLAGHGFIGNYLEPAGAYPEAYLGPHDLFIPSGAYDVLLAIACVSGALLAGLVLSRARRLPLELSLFGAVTVLGTAFELVQGHLVYDRYLLPLTVTLVPLVLLDPLRCSVPGLLHTARRALAGLAAVVVAVAMTLLGANAFAFDAANWHAAQNLVSAGKADAQHVDAGLDWTGYHSPNGMQNTKDANLEPGIDGADGYLGIDDPCYLIAAQDQSVPGWTLAGTWKYHQFGVAGPIRKLRIYRTTSTTCR
jgi:hypothetical protein